MGFTDDVARRAKEHKDKIYESFTKFYNVNKLVISKSIRQLMEQKNVRFKSKNGTENGKKIL